MLLRKILLYLNDLMFRYACEVRVRGRERAAPLEEGVVLASNHIGIFDPMLIYHLAWREDVIVPVAKKWGDRRLTKMLVDAAGAVLLDRDNPDFGALRVVRRRLQAGGVLILAPEGTRSPHGALIKGRPGAAYMAIKTGVPVVPVAVTGTREQDVLASWRRLKRPVITVTFGDPFLLPELDARDRSGSLARATDNIMFRIAALLPEDMRGVYRDSQVLEEISLRTDAHA